MEEADDQPTEEELQRRLAISRKDPQIEERFAVLAERLGIADYVPAKERQDSFNT